MSADKNSNPQKNTGLALLGKDLDRLGHFVKRAGTLGAVLGFLHHLHCLAN